MFLYGSTYPWYTGITNIYCGDWALNKPAVLAAEHQTVDRLLATGW